MKNKQNEKEQTTKQVLIQSFLQILARFDKLSNRPLCSHIGGVACCKC